MLLLLLEDLRLLLLPVAAAARFMRLRLNWRLNERVMLNDGFLGIVLLLLLLFLPILRDDNDRPKLLLLLLTAVAIVGVVLLVLCLSL